MALDMTLLERDVYKMRFRCSTTLLNMAALGALYFILFCLLQHTHVVYMKSKNLFLQQSRSCRNFWKFLSSYYYTVRPSRSYALLFRFEFVCNLGNVLNEQ
jgi:hypothetical protein